MRERTIIAGAGRRVPLTPLVCLTAALCMLYALLWLSFTLPCGWSFDASTGNRCARNPSVALPVLAIAVMPVGAIVAFRRQRWWPFAIGCCLAVLVPLSLVLSDNL